MTKSVWVADLEANGLLDTVTKIWCVVFKNVQTGEVKTFHHGQPEWEKRCMEFMDSIDVLIMHNGIGYDWPALSKVWGYKFKGRKVDSLVVSRLLCTERMSHSVESYGKQFNRWKPEHEDWTQFSPEMLHRCVEDTEIQFLIWKYLNKRITPAWHHALDLTHELFTYLQMQEEYGWLIDMPYAQRCIRQLTTWIDRIDRAVEPELPHILVIKEGKVKGVVNHVKKPFLKSGAYSAPVHNWMLDSGYNPDDRIVGGPFSRIDYRKVNLDSNAEMKDYLLSQGWEPKEWNIKVENGVEIKTSPKLSLQDKFKGLRSKAGRLLAKRVQVRHRRSQIQGWIERVRPDGRIAARVAGIADSYRMKHSGVVNVPGAGAFYGAQMRKCFSSKPNFTLVSADAASCQDRMLAERAGNPDFTEMLLNGDSSIGTDGHSLATKAVNKALERNGLPTIIRKVGKNFNFAYKFGASDNKLGKMVGKGKELGAEIREELGNVFPALQALIEKLEAEWKQTATKTWNSKWRSWDYKNGSITGADGRPVKFESPHKCLVMAVQSDEAIYMSKVYCLAFKKLLDRFKWGEEWGMCCFYHDELTIEIREEYAQEAALLIEEAFTEASNFLQFNHCPQAGTAEIGKNWLEVH